MKRLVSLLFATALALGSLFAVGVAPAAAAVTCPGGSAIVGSGTTYVVVYESANYAANQTSNQHTLCIRASSTGSTLIPNLKNVSYTDFGNEVCDGQLATSYGTWNDCVSSFKVGIDCHHSVAFYQDANYGALDAAYSVSHNQATLAFGHDNTYSSIKVTYHSVCQTSPVQ